jgi:hypothetical protein
MEFGPIDETCPCPTCTSGTSRALLHSLITLETVAAHGASVVACQGPGLTLPSNPTTEQPSLPYTALFYWGALP